MRAFKLLVWTLAALVTAVVGCGGDGDSEATGAEGTGTLFVQSAESGGFEVSGGAGTLTLRGVSPATTTFSDRPERVSGALSTATFASNFDQAFGEDPPNAAVSSTELDRGTFTVELSQPSYDEAARTLTYTVRPIGAEGSNLPRSFGPVSVFIDYGCDTADTAVGIAC